MIPHKNNLHLPTIGTFSLDFGIIPAKTSMKTTWESTSVMDIPSRSPDSAGSTNVRVRTKASTAVGIIRLICNVIRGGWKRKIISG